MSNNRKIKVGKISYENIKIDSRYDLYDHLDTVENILDIISGKGLLGIISKVFIDDKCGDIAIYLTKGLSVKAGEEILDPLFEDSEMYGCLVNLLEYEFEHDNSLPF